MRILLLLTIWLAGAAWGQDLAPLADEEKQLLLQRAQALRDKAALMRSDAEAALIADKQACWDKFLVSGCQDDATRVKIERVDAARRIEQEARGIERRLRQREHAQREAGMAAAAARRAVDAAAQAERNRLEQQQALERVERNRREAEQRDKR